MFFLFRSFLLLSYSISNSRPTNILSIQDVQLDLVAVAVAAMEVLVHRVDDMNQVEVVLLAVGVDFVVEDHFFAVVAVHMDYCQVAVDHPVVVVVVEEVRLDAEVVVVPIDSALVDEAVVVVDMVVYI